MKEPLTAQKTYWAAFDTLSPSDSDLDLLPSKTLPVAERLRGLVRRPVFRLRYETDRFDVRLYARNLFDRFCPLRRVNQALTTETGVIAGTPREFGIILTAQYRLIAEQVRAF